MGRRPDAAIYQAALAELRDTHLTKFQRIYKRRLAEAGIFHYDKNEMNKAVVGFIAAFTKEHGYGPTRADILENVGIPSSSLTLCVKQLKKDGILVPPGSGGRQGSYELVE